MPNKNAYDLGYESYFVGTEIDDNPYKMTTDDFQEWELGFLDAMNIDCLEQSDE